MKPKKVLITGMSGYIGGALCRTLEHRAWCIHVDGCDIRPPLDRLDKVTFRRLDINDPALGDWIVECAPDVLIHLAYVVDPIHDEALMHRINVDGTHAVLAAAVRAFVPQIMVASSGTAYGAWPDNPVPLREDDPIRPHPTFQYAREKAEVESICAQFMADHPDVVFSVIRPCVLYGPRVRNYLARLLTGLPVVIGLAGYNPDLQFVHEDDVCEAICAILEQEARGAFNIAPPDSLSMEETLHLAGKPVVKLPDRVLTGLADLMWRAHIKLLGAPSPFLDYLRYPWVLDPGRLIDELGFRFRYSSRDAVTIMLRAKGVLR
ncbi:MAG: NAD-dependent epimerase/dehydratase family protein [bacterium]